MATSLALVAIGAGLPFTPVGRYFGFVPPPAQFYLILAAMVVTYLVIVELAKKGFYPWHAVSGKTGRTQGSVARFPSA
jgi:Mg2+-importing ATPase